MKREIDLLEKHNQDLSKEVRDLREQNAKLIAERDQFRKDTKEIFTAKRVIEKKYENDKVFFKERETKMQQLLSQANKENNEYQDEIILLNKFIKQLQLEKEKSKARI